MKWKKRLINCGVLFASVVAGLFLCEWLCRMVLNPVDYLSPVLERDEILGMRLPPGSGGHDDWGFRNAKVPDSVDIVAIGDSHTYGNCAKMNESWPHVLAGLSGKSVYNMGMGGYGPNQYHYLLRTKALSLKPRTVICGLYLGDDFDNAFRITYGLDHWKSLRREGVPDADPDIWEKDESGSLTWHKKVRNWLSQHSVLYRLVVHGMLQKAKSDYQTKHASELYDSCTTLSVPEKKVEESFLPKGILLGLDQQSSSVQEGMRLTFQLLKEMNATCVENKISFIVAVIPAKEAVFARYLEGNTKLNLADTLDRLITSERAARQKLFEYLKRENIRFIDLLPAMETASESEKLYYPGPADMHPVNNGYRVIARAIAEGLKAAQD